MSPWRGMACLTPIIDEVRADDKETEHKMEYLANGATGTMVVTIDNPALNDPDKFKQFQRVQGELSGALSRLMAVAEAYPDLKANRNYLELQSQLEGTENRIAQERMRFNTTVQTYNTAIRVFPSSLVASFRGFGPKEFFQADAGAEKVPQVKF